jgi:hemoglobin
MYKLGFYYLIMLFLLALGGCTALNSSDKAQNISPNATLFQRIGGLPVLNKIVDEFVDKVSTSPRTKRSFDGVKLKPLKESIVAHLCKLTGGGCVYEGETMANAHRDSKITESEFDAFVDIFRDTLNVYLPTREKNELLKILAPMKRDIVEKK